MTSTTTVERATQRVPDAGPTVTLAEAVRRLVSVCPETATVEDEILGAALATSGDVLVPRPTVDALVRHFSMLYLAGAAGQVAGALRLLLLGLREQRDDRPPALVEWAQSYLTESRLGLLGG